MEPWGAQLFGDPCCECGFDWSLTPRDAVAYIASVPARVDEATAGADGTERSAGWSVTQYVSHVADNLHQWAERVQAARLSGQVDVAGYDPDALATARGYAAIPLRAAAWSLRVSVDAWVETLSAALEESVVLQHATRGQQRAEDIARNNAHDAHHHVWDIEGLIAAAEVLQ